LTSNENTYLLDPESLQEMARLAWQGRLVTQALGLVPTTIDLSNLLRERESQAGTETLEPFRVLDVGCGPGDWGLELAAKYKDTGMKITGIDISNRMVQHATAQAESQETPSVEFQVMNALKPLQFPDATFDLVNMRLALAFIPRERWPFVIQECKRVLRPGGVFVSTEGENGTHTYHSPKTAQLIHWLCQALAVKGLGFWDGYSSMHGVHGMQLLFFREAGFENIQAKVSLIEASYNSEQYLGWLDMQKTMVEFIEPIVCGPLGVSKDLFNAVLEESYLEVRQKEFCSVCYFQTVSGQKPRL
jgi:ubiquinone/menaquinone biosynthesis C-methylase UbiE